MLNHIAIMGRLTKDPETRYTQSQIPVTSFTLAVDRDFQPQTGDKQTDFVDCTAWRGTAEFVSKYFQKGSMAVVSGRLESRNWEDRNGQKRTSWEVNVDSIYFGESKKAAHAAPAEEPEYDPQPQTFTDAGNDDGDLPF